MTELIGRITLTILMVVYFMLVIVIVCQIAIFTIQEVIAATKPTKEEYHDD